MNIRLIGLGIGIVVTALAALMIFFGPQWEKISSLLFSSMIALFVGILFGLLAHFVLKKFSTKPDSPKATKLAQEDSGEAIKEDEESNHRYDASVTRNKKLRWLVLILSVFSSITLPVLILGTVSTLLPFSDLTLFPTAVVGMIVGVTFFSRILPRFIVDVPQVQGFITINKLVSLLSTFGAKGATDVIYGPGWHVSYPWEGRSEKSNFSLEVFTLDWNEEVPGLTTQLLVTGSYQFEVDLPRSDRFIGIDEETIKKGALEIIKAYVSNMLSKESGDDAKSKILTYNDELMNEFGLEEKKDASKPETEVKKAPKVTAFEARYGLKSVAITISGIDLPEKVQETRDAVDEAQQVINGVAAMYGMEVDALKAKLAEGTISSIEYNEMLDRFAAKSGNAEMKINSVKLHGLEGLAPLVKKLTGG